MTSTTPVWRKSSRSGGNHGACVEVAVIADGIGIRDSKNPDTPYLNFSGNAFAALLRTMQQGR